MKKIQSFFVLSIVIFVPSVFASTDLGDPCGPPTLLPEWRNISSNVAETARLKCPLDTKNSCLVNFVEWYKKEFDPRTDQHVRKLLRPNEKIMIFAFDPLLLYFESVRPEDEGWYYCVVGNSDGRSEQSTYLSVQIPQVNPVKYKPTSARPDSTPMPTTRIPDTRPARDEETASVPEETPRRRDPSPELISYLQSHQTRPSRVSYGSSRYSYHGAGGYAPWYDRQDAESTTSQTEPSVTSTPQPVVPAVYRTMTTKQQELTTTTVPPVQSSTTRAYEVPQQNYPDISYQGGQKSRQRMTLYKEYFTSTPTTSASPTVTLTSGQSTDDSPTSRQHLEAIHEHLRYIYDRMDDLVKRVEQLEGRNSI